MINSIIFDIDGTIYLGGQPINGVPDALKELRSQGKKVFFLSNAATRSREDQTEKLNQMGIQADVSEVYNSAYAIADYVARNIPEKTVYVIGEGGVQDELRKKGITVLDDEKADVVAVGLDRTFTWDKLAIANRAIREGAVFLATNLDPVYPDKTGLYPGCGSLVAAVESASGKKPDAVVGKPNPYMLEEIAKDHNLKKDGMIMVGDRYETDILAAKNFGIKSVAVLTGVLKKSEIDNLEKKPDYILESVQKLPNLLSSL